MMGSLKGIKRKIFEILEHTADLRIRVFGSSPKELFENALYAMAYIQKPDIVKQSILSKIKGKITSIIRQKNIYKEIEIESMDYNTLLIDFLSEVLSQSDSENAVFFKVKFKEFSENKLVGEIWGIRVDEFDEDIKAVTYHEVEVKEVAPGKWESLIVFDI